MKIVVALSASTRGGIDFFQSLLDKHTQISQFPGELYIDELIAEFKYMKSVDEISNTFIKKYQRYFDSSSSIIERHNCLGEKKNQSYKVCTSSFKKYFNSFLEQKSLNTKNIIHGLHLAYSAASGEDTNKKKIILLQVHHLFRIKSMIDLDFDIICTIRDPLAAYISYVKNLAYYRKKTPNPWQFYYHLERTFNHLNYIIKLKRKIIIIKLEDLHRENKKVMKKLCNYFDINYENTLSISSFHGLLWWGDQVSKKNLNGVNSNFENKIDKNIFFENDIRLIEYNLSDFINKYCYEFRYEKNKNKILKFLPLKFELEMFISNFKNFEFKNLLFVFYYYLKRLIKINIKKNNENIILPEKF